MAGGLETAGIIQTLTILDFSHQKSENKHTEIVLDVYGRKTPMPMCGSQSVRREGWGQGAGTRGVLG